MNRKRLIAGALLAVLPLGVGALVLQGQTGSTGPRLFAQVLRMVEEHSVDSLSSAQIYEKAARGLVKNLDDPYADLYSPEQLASFQRSTLGNNYGLLAACHQAIGNYALAVQARDQILRHLLKGDTLEGIRHCGRLNNIAMTYLLMEDSSSCVGVA